MGSDSSEPTAAASPSPGAPAGDTPDQAPTGPRPSAIAARVLIAIATLLAVVSLFAVWADRQVLDSGNWATTSSQLLGSDPIRTQTAQYITDQIYNNVDVQAEIEKALPDQVQVLAGPAADALRGLAQDAISKALATSAVQTVWQEANRLAAQQFIDVVNEKQTGLVQSQGNDIKLDLRPAVLKLAARLGLATQAAKIPAGAADVPVFSGKAIGDIRTYAKVLSGGAVLFPLLTLLLYVGAVAISPGRRRRTMIAIAWSLILAALIVLVARGVVGNAVVGSLALTDASKPAANAVWDIGSTMLSSVAWNTIIVAVIALLVLAIGGPRRAAVAIRAWAAPWLRDKPNLAYGAVYGVVLLILIWGPLPFTREPVAVLILLVLTGLGTWALSRQTAVEFPDASAAEQSERIGAAWDRARRSLGSGISRGAAGARSAASQVRGRVAQRPDQEPGRSDTATQPAARGDEVTARQAPVAAVDEDATEILPTQGDRVSALERLAALKESGVLSEEEFAGEKRRILGS